MQIYYDLLQLSRLGIYTLMALTFELENIIIKPNQKNNEIDRNNINFPVLYHSVLSAFFCFCYVIISLPRKGISHFQFLYTISPMKR